MEGKFDLEAIPRENLGQSVYGQLSDALVKGRFAPNMRLTIRELASSLGTSVTPVRDAVLRLIQDEALVQRTAREVRVPVLSLEDYAELMKVRLRIEGLAAREAALKATPEEIAVLTDLSQRNEEAIAARRWTDAFDLNQTFHFRIAEIANLPLLHGFLHRIWLKMGPVIAESHKEGSSLRLNQHYRLIAAIRDRDPVTAEQAMISDMSDVGDVMVAYLQRLNEAVA